MAEPKAPNTFAECMRCGCAFAYYKKPKTDANGNPIETPADHVEHGASIACPGCNYYAASLLSRDKAAAFFTLAFFAVFPALMLMFAKPLASQASVVSPDTADLIFKACLYLVAAIGAVAVLGGLFYHPTRAPFNKFTQQARLLREGRPKDQWHAPQTAAAPTTAETPALSGAATAEPLDDIAPPPDFVAPKTREDEDEEDDDLAGAPAPSAAPPPVPRPMPHSATGAPLGVAHGTRAGESAATDTIVLQCPQCHKKFRAPRAVLSGTPKCKVCNVVLIDVSPPPQRVG